MVGERAGRGSPPPRDEVLAEQFVAIARTLQAGQHPEAIQERITRTALGTVGGCESAAISLVRRGGPLVTVAATDDLASAVDAVQYEAGQGPCLDAVWHEPVYRTDDLRGIEVCAAVKNVIAIATGKGIVGSITIEFII